ncbi:MAG: leucine-rich repeat domain-containing protein [Nocardioides sp.]
MLRDGSVPPLRLDDDAYVEREYHATLAAAIRASGGQWTGSDYYARPADIVAEIHRVGATALRLSLRDLSPLGEVAGLWHLDVESDGSAALGPVSALSRLRSLNLSVRGIRGVLEPSSLPALRWLTTPLGGKGGAPVLASLVQGHPTLEHLRVRETKVRSIGAIVANLPQLQSFSVSYADFIRTPGDLAPVADTLTELRMSMVPGLRSLDGIETAPRLERFALWGGSVTDLSPLAALPNLREVDITMAGGVRITDVNDLP